jgi:hypothetical protein
MKGGARDEQPRRDRRSRDAIGIYAVAFGVLLVILAFRVRSFVSRVTGG